MFEVVAKKSPKKKEVDLVLYGTIGQWRQVSADDFIRSISGLAAKGYKVINCLINSPGGAVFEADAVGAIINRYQARGIVFNAYVDGIAASAMSFLICYMDKVFMAKNAHIMMHQAMISSDRQQAHELRKKAEMLDKINLAIAAMYAEKTGKEVEWILSNWMKPNTDKWFTASEALKEGLCDEVAPIKVKLPKKSNEDTSNMSLAEIAAMYGESFNALLENVIANSNPNNSKSNQNDMERTLLVQACTRASLEFSADASDEELLNKLSEGLVNAQALLADQAKEISTLRNASNYKLIDDAVAEVKITNEQAKIYKGMVDQGQGETVKTLLATIEPPRDLVKEIGQNKAQDDKKKEEGKVDEKDRQKWTYQDYIDKDKNSLLELQNSNPEKYEEIVNAHLDAAFDED